MAKIILNVSADIKTAESQLKSLRTTIDEIAKSLSTAKVDGSFTSAVKALTEQYKALAQAAKSVNTEANKQREADDKHALALERLRKAEELTAMATEKRARANAKAAEESAKAAEKQAAAEEKASKKTLTAGQNLQKQYANLLNTINSIKNRYPQGTFDAIFGEIKTNLADIKALNATMNENGQATQQDAEKIELLKEKYAELAASVSTTRAETEKNTSAVIENGDSILNMAKKFVIWQAAATLVMQPLNKIRQALSSINETLVETEKSVISIQRVLKETVGEGEIADRLYDLAQRYGQTFANVSEIVTNFARSGMSWSESLQAAEAALTALNVAELNAGEATEGLIAIMAQFKLEAQDLSYVVDVLNKTADNANVTTEKLLSALQKTGSYASEANLSLEDTVALITALSESTAASGQNIGNALRSLLAFTTRDTALDLFAGLSSGMSDTVSMYRTGTTSILDVWKGLADEIGGIESQQGSLSALLGGAELTDEARAELTELESTLTEIYNTAGTYRKNYFIALLNDMDGVEKAMDNLSEVNGYSAQENEKYLNTYEAKLNSLDAHWQKLANDEQGILGFKKSLVDIADLGLTILEWTGGLRTEFLKLGTLAMVIWGEQIVAKIKQFNVHLSTNVSNMIHLKQAFENARTAQESATLIQQQYEAAQAAGTATTEMATAASEAHTAALEAEAAAQAAVISWIGIAITVISMVVGIIQKANAEYHAHNQELIANGEAIRDNALALKELYGELGDNAEVEDKIVKLLGDKATALDGLTKGTDEYREAVKNLTEAEIKEYRIRLMNAQEAAKEELETGLFGDLLGNSDPAARPISGKNGQTFRDLGLTSDSGQFLKGVNVGASADPFRSADVELANYAALVEARDMVYEAYNSALRSGDSDNASRYKDALLELENRVEEMKPAIEAYEQATKALREFEKEMNNTGRGGKNGNLDNPTKTLLKDLSQVGDKYKEIVSALKEARDIQKDQATLAEKQLDIEKARQDLENARSQKNVRVYNAATGLMEWQANASDIKNAQDNLANAVDALNKFAEEQAWEEVLSEFGKETTTTKAILDIIGKWAEISAEDNPAFASQIATIISNASGVTVGSAPVYDKGGVLTGIGGIKLTSRNEGVITDPEITSQILSPSANAQFSAFVEDLRQLFGFAQNTAQIGQISRQNGNSDNRQYIVNGVPIPAETAQRYTLAEIFDAMPIAP